MSVTKAVPRSLGHSSAWSWCPLDEASELGASMRKASAKVSPARARLPVRRHLGTLTETAALSRIRQHSAGLLLFGGEHLPPRRQSPACAERGRATRLLSP